MVFMSDSNKESSLLMSTDEYIDFMCLTLSLRKDPYRVPPNFIAKCGRLF